MTNTLEDSDWDNLMVSIKEKKCTPFIGAGACAGTLPLGSDIARRWAKQHKYPLKDDWDLAKVSQFVAIQKYGMFPKEDIWRQFQLVDPPDFTKPDEPHALLAKLNLPIYITTNYDSFMSLALEKYGRDPKREFCRWNKIIKKEGPSLFKPGYSPSEANPLVYHLHGHYELPQSLVLTEDDYLEFLVSLSSNPALLPPAIRKALAGTSLLFIGYSLSDWNFRVLFRGLIGPANLQYPGVAVQLAPDANEDSVDGRRRAQDYLNAYFGQSLKIKVRVYWGDIKEFTNELGQRWEKFSNGTK